MLLFVRLAEVRARVMSAIVSCSWECVA